MQPNALQETNGRSTTQTLAEAWGTEQKTTTQDQPSGRSSAGGWRSTMTKGVPGRKLEDEEKILKKHVGQNL